MTFTSLEEASKKSIGSELMGDNKDETDSKDVDNVTKFLSSMFPDAGNALPNQRSAVVMYMAEKKQRFIDGVKRRFTLDNFLKLLHLRANVNSRLREIVVRNSDNDGKEVSELIDGHNSPLARLFVKCHCVQPLVLFS